VRLRRACPGRPTGELRSGSGRMPPASRQNRLPRDPTPESLQQVLGDRYIVEREVGAGGWRSCSWPRTGGTSAGGDQGPRPRHRRGRGRALSARGADHRPAPAHPHRAAARRVRRGARAAVRGDAVRRGGVAPPAAHGPGPAADGGKRLDRVRGGRCAGLRAPPGGDPPRHQAGEHPHLQRARRGGRLRRGARHRARGWRHAHGCRIPDRDRGVHEPGTGHRRFPGGRTERRLQSRVRALRNAGGTHGVHRAQPQERPHPAAHHRSAAAPHHPS
jgi:hypothetical protein